MVLATQNPLESYGTYPLPEAQIDRFMIKISVGYPDYQDEVRIVLGVEEAKKINISSTKPCHGHCLGATGAIEAAITALAIKDGFVPPTINYEKPDLEVDVSKGETPLDLNYTPNVGVKRDIEVAISTSLGFGGHNGVLVLKKV